LDESGLPDTREADQAHYLAGLGQLVTEFIDGWSDRLCGRATMPAEMQAQFVIEYVLGIHTLGFTAPRTVGAPAY
jgi:hypothetical protein